MSSELPCTLFVFINNIIEILLFFSHNFKIEDAICVVFHVFVPDEFLGGKDDKVLIRFGRIEFGGWNDKSHLMTYNPK